MTRIIYAALPAASLMIALGACSPPVNGGANQAAQNANKPGWTGSTRVIGSTSTIGGDSQATYDQQKWGVGRQH